MSSQDQGQTSLKNILQQMPGRQYAYTAAMSDIGRWFLE